LSKNSATDWVTVAILGRPRGLRGELTAISLSSHPDRFKKLTTVHLFGDGSPYEVERTWDHQGVLIFKFKGVDSMTDAEKFRGFEVRVPLSERVEPEAGEFFHSDLIGCEVRDAATQRVIGKVTDFEEFGGPPLLQINGGSLLVPFVKEICTGIHPEQKLILVTLPEGLEDVNKL
jgi:16S rRNA processing protein RimM